MDKPKEVAQARAVFTRAKEVVAEARDLDTFHQMQLFIYAAVLGCRERMNEQVIADAKRLGIPGIERAQKQADYKVAVLDKAVERVQFNLKGASIAIGLMELVEGVENEKS